MSEKKVFNGVHDALSFMQKTIVALKDRDNNFGKYKYRSCEDIFQAIKKVLPDAASVTCSDMLIMVGDRYYVQATATFRYKDEYIQNTALAREEEVKKGMDSAQITGTASSYARKYALSGLFAIDDNKDIDEGEEKGTNTQPPPLPKPEPKKVADRTEAEWMVIANKFEAALATCVDIAAYNALIEKASPTLQDMRKYAEDLAAQVDDKAKRKQAELLNVK